MDQEQLSVKIGDRYILKETGLSVVVKNILEACDEKYNGRAITYQKVVAYNTLENTLERDACRLIEDFLENFEKDDSPDVVITVGETRAIPKEKNKMEGSGDQMEYSSDATGAIGCLVGLLIIVVAIFAGIDQVWGRWSAYHEFHDKYCTMLFRSYDKVMECKNTSPRDLTKFIKVHQSNGRK